MKNDTVDISSNNLDTISYVVTVDRDDATHLVVRYEAYGKEMDSFLEAKEDLNSLNFIFQQVFNQMEKERSN